MAIKCLFGARAGTLAMVIDDTGSMGSEISGVRAAVNSIVSSVVGTDNEPKQYLLERYGDPDIGPPVTNVDSAQFLSAVNALSPGGGGDCPERTNAALLEAIGASLKDSQLYVFTDASSNDALLRPFVLAAAWLKDISISYLLTGSCSPIDASYIQVAEQTGGQVYFLTPGEIPQAFALVTPQLAGEFVTIDLSKGQVAGTPTDRSVTLDSTLARAVFSLARTDGVGTAFMDVIRPDGTFVAPGDVGVTIVSLSTGRIAIVDAPAAGIWKIRTSGVGGYSAIVRGNSPLQLANVDFVVAVNPIHSGYAPISGQPAVGSDETLRATLIGRLTASSFRAVTDDGAQIQAISLLQGDPLAPMDDFVGIMPVPAQPFRVMATGTNGAGEAFQRVFPRLFTGQSVIVAFQDIAIPSSIAPGSTIDLPCEVMNLGNSATFILSAVDSQGFSAVAIPSSVALATGEASTFIVRVSAPSSATSGAQSIVSVIARSASAPDITNSDAVELLIGGNSPPMCGPSTPAMVMLWPPNHKLVPIDVVAIAGVTDPDSDPLTVVIDSITQDEPVDAAGVGDGHTFPDAEGVGGPSAFVRAERAVSGDGRVYHIHFTVSDGNGGSCSGSVNVGVALNRGNGNVATDGGELFDSTLP